MKGITCFTLLFATLLSAGVAQGENLAEIYTQALRNDPGIREAEAQMLAEKESRPQARASLLPQVKLDANFSNSISDGVFTNQFGNNLTTIDQESDNDTKNWSLSLSQALFNTDAWRKFRRANHEDAKAEADYQVARQALIVRVAEAYFDVLAAQDTLASERATKEAIARQLEQAERRFEVGLIAITDVKESQAAYDDAIALEIAARRLLATGKEGLREITGEYPQSLATPGDEFPLIPPDPQVEQDWVDIALQQNAELESAKIATEVSRENIRIARSGHFPTVGLTADIGNFKQDGVLTDNTDPTLRGTTDNDQDRRQIGINFSLPIFSGGGTSSIVQQNVYQHRAARENYEKVARNTERQTRDAYLGVIAEIARVRALARSVESNQTALEATEAGYDVGTRTTVDVLNARESLFRAETQYARSKYDYLINIMKLKLAAGTLNGTDVEEINNWLVISEQLERIPGRGGEPDAEMEESSVPTRPDAQSDQS
jgi:outer membrane protein